MMKKGSLQLSINAIVVLVLAITMLGMGLAFTKGKFAELGNKIEVPEPDYPATQDDPVVFAVDQLKVRKDDTVRFSVNFYNDGDSGSYYPCVQNSSGYAISGTDAVLQGQTVNTGEYETFRVILNSGKGWTSSVGTQILTVHFFHGTAPTGTACNIDGANALTPVASKQLIVKVS